jgi:hypothetical protein
MVAFFPEELPGSVRNDPRPTGRGQVLRCAQGPGSSRSADLLPRRVARPNANGPGPRDGETEFIIASPESGVLLDRRQGGTIRYGRGGAVVVDRSAWDHSGGNLSDRIVDRLQVVRWTRLRCAYMHQRRHPLVLDRCLAQDPVAERAGLEWMQRLLPVVGETREVLADAVHANEPPRARGGCLGAKRHRGRRGMVR